LNVLGQFNINLHGNRNNLHKIQEGSFLHLETASEQQTAGVFIVTFVFNSIIVKLKEHEEFFPVFHSFILELLQTLGETKLYSCSTSQSNSNEKYICILLYLKPKNIIKLTLTLCCGTS